MNYKTWIRFNPEQDSIVLLLLTLFISTTSIKRLLTLIIFFLQATFDETNLYKRTPPNLHISSCLCSNFHFWFFYWLSIRKITLFFTLVFCACVLICFTLTRNLPFTIWELSFQVFQHLFSICPQPTKFGQLPAIRRNPIIYKRQNSLF